MSESTIIQRLRREIQVLEQDNARLRERIDIQRDKEIKLLNDIIELKERMKEREE